MPATGGMSTGTFEVDNFDYYDIKAKIAALPGSEYYDACAGGAYYYDKA